MAVPEGKEFEFKDKDFAFIVAKAYEHTGIKLADSKRDMVYGRLARRLRELKFKTFSQYCQFLESDRGDEEIGKFVNAVTTNLTGFFREAHHFQHLKEELKKMVARPPAGKRLRIWSAACSSGPEPYSIAMTLKEAISNLSVWDAKILATDIDTNMIQTAQKGEYRRDILDKIPGSYLSKYTVGRKKEPTGQMSEEIRKLITFKQLNLLHNWPMKGPFDAIFCRNVVIYFDKDTQRVLFDKMADLLKPEGTLYIGHSETLFNICDRFELIGKTIYKKRE